MINYVVKTFSLPVPEPYKSQARQLAITCFDYWATFTPAEEEEHADRYCSQADWYKFIFAIEDEIVIGSVTTLKRQIPFNGNQILLGGLGGVSTHPDKRNQGVASTLLKVAMEELRAANCDIAYLCTDISNPAKVHLYEKYGFKVLANKHTYLGKSGKRYIDNDGMIAPVCSADIFNKVLNSPEPFNIGTGNW